MCVCVCVCVCVDVCAVKLHLILHRRHIISFLSPVDGVWLSSVAAEVVPLGSRAVLQKAECKKKKQPSLSKKQVRFLRKQLPVWAALPVAQTRGETFEIQ